MRQNSRISFKNPVDYYKYIPPKENLRGKRPAEVVKREPDDGVPAERRTWLIGSRHHVETVLSHSEGYGTQNVVRLHDHKDKSLANLMVDKKLAVATEYLFPEKFAINRPIAGGIRIKPISTFFPLASILVPATLQIQYCLLRHL
ncbi:hypothetical protein DAPPUDRAFT_248519 [Daphnia pulex]|uniref:Uncharacterized protein n=1 Tax=Daphnia pulex TaxID=6669 RepID=E9GUU0_DAPPU|nr:hypothetical protein DAPPUDRAFT_248519 [Daphnia pulex]|eukprot:EFX76795.1 hypothetical protein DAPPUDRAFT_248519 [Daphnia pulex]